MINITKLSYIPIDKTVIVSTLEAKGTMRRRLLDLGFISGNSVTPLFSDRKKSITAYSVSGAVIALRSDASDSILVEYDEECLDE